MTSRITPIVGFLVALWPVAPAAAPASPLLSGYGGPGQGNQAILGSALLNGPRSGGGGGSGAGGGSSTTGASSTAAQSGRRSTASAPSAASGASKQATGGAPRSTGRGAAIAEGSGQGGASSLYPASDRGGAAQQSGALGLSGEDFVYIIVGLGILALTAVLTKRLARIKRAGG